MNFARFLRTLPLAVSGSIHDNQSKQIQGFQLRACDDNDIS